MQQNYVREEFEGGNNIPFPMVFMELPSENALFSSANRTTCTVYTTSSGPCSSPDDGTQTQYDD